jgi:hypothetical protein
MKGFVHSRAMSGYIQAAKESVVAMEAARAQYVSLKESVERLRATASGSIEGNIQNVLKQYNSLKDKASKAAQPFSTDMQLLLENMGDEQGVSETISKIEATILRIELDYAVYLVNDVPYMAKLQYYFLKPLETFINLTCDAIEVAHENPELSAVAFLFFMAIAAYISIKLGLAFIRVVIWLCIKMPLYVLKSIYNYLLGNDEEEFDLRDNLLQEAGDDVSDDDKQSGKKTTKTVYSTSPYLSSGLPRSALYGDDAHYVAGIKADDIATDLKHLHADIELVHSDKEAATKGAAPKDSSSAVSTTLCSLSVVVAALALLF